jgi:hypothetical protein
MKTALIAISLGIATCVTALAGDKSNDCKSKEKVLERYGCYLGKGAQGVSHSAGQVAKQGYQETKRWWGENKDEVKAKTLELGRKTEVGIKRAAEGTGKFLNGLKSGLKR